MDSSIKHSGKSRSGPSLMDHVSALASGFAWAVDVSHRIDREAARHNRLDHGKLKDIVFCQ